MSPDPIKPTNGNGNGDKRPVSSGTEPESSLAPVASLKPKQSIAAWALASGDTQRVAAEKAKVTERTVSTWIQLPAFRDAVRNGNETFLSFVEPAESAGRHRVGTFTPEAADKLIEMIRADDTDDTNRLRGIFRVLDAASIGAAKGSTQVNVAIDARTAIDATYTDLEGRRVKRGEAPPR